MLERAAQCLENAGQRLFCHPKHGIRTRRRLCSGFWRYGSADFDVSWDFLGLLQSMSGKIGPHATTLESRRNSASSFSQDFHLEFLYPPNTQTFVRTHPQSSLRSPVHRRRRKGTTHRTYSSGPVSPLKISSDDSSKSSGWKDSQNGENRQYRELRQLLDSETDRNAYDKVWTLFLNSESPNDMKSRLLLYLSNSERSIDAQRLKATFDSIPLHDRNSEDYWCVTRALLREKQSDNIAIDVCKEAVARFSGESCWGFALAVFVSRKDWDRCLLLWRNKPYPPNNFPPLRLKSVELSELTSLPNRLLELLNSIEQGSFRLSMHGLSPLTRFLAHITLSSKKVMDATPMETTLLIFKKLKSVHLLEPRHYFEAILTLASLDVRTGAIRSMVVYRNFRWEMSDQKAPENVLTGILRVLCALEVFEGIHYLIQEFRNFYGKPSVNAYHTALTTLARLGDVPNLESMFKDFVRDHGVPSEQKLLSPLLYVHARLGHAHRTQQRLEELCQETGLTPNVVWWNILITAYANSGDVSNAIMTLKKMIQQGVNPDTHTFGSMMGLMARRGDINGVMDLLRAARRYNVQVNSVLIDTVIETLCNNRKYAEAQALATEAIRLNPPGSLTRTFNILLWNYAFLSDPVAMVRIQDQMRKARIAFDGFTYAALMLSLVISRKTGQARYILYLLHRNRRIQITELHYAIILHGYVKSKNRDMAHVVYKEICERFPEPSPSSKLAMIKTNVQRDLQSLSESGGPTRGNDIRLPHAEQFLEAVMESFDIKTFATKQPQPGSKKRSVKEAFPVAYFEHLISEYGSRGAFGKVTALFDEYMAKERSLSDTGDNNQGVVPPLQLLHTLMVKDLREEKHDELEACWNTAFERTLNLAKPTLALSNLGLGDSVRNNPGSDGKPAQPAPNSHTKEGPIAGNGLVLFSYRYTLSYCLSVLIESLATRKLYSRIFDVITQVEKAGFQLTTHNWTLLVKFLCLSSNPKDQFRAFALFEDRFIQNFPGWNNIKRSYVRRPRGAPATLDLIEERPWRRGKPPSMLGKAGRSLWSKIQPDYMQPTYVNMVYLGSALIDFKARSVLDGGVELRSLSALTPKTFSAVSELPFLRDKFQGILLRGRDLIERRDERPRDIEPRGPVWTGGVLGIKNERRFDTSPKSDKFNPQDPEPKNHQLQSLLEEDVQWRQVAERKEKEKTTQLPARLRTLRLQDLQDLEHDTLLKDKSLAKSQLARRKRTWKRGHRSRGKQGKGESPRARGHRRATALMNPNFSFLRHV